MRILNFTARTVSLRVKAVDGYPYLLNTESLKTEHLRHYLPEGPCPVVRWGLSPAGSAVGLPLWRSKVQDIVNLPDEVDGVLLLVEPHIGTAAAELGRFDCVSPDWTTALTCARSGICTVARFLTFAPADDESVWSPAELTHEEGPLCR